MYLRKSINMKNTFHSFTLFQVESFFIFIYLSADTFTLNKTRLHFAYKFGIINSPY